MLTKIVFSSNLKVTSESLGEGAKYFNSSYTLCLKQNPQKKYLKHYPQKKMYSYILDEEKKECALGSKDILLLAGQESQECCVFYF